MQFLQKSGQSSGTFPREKSCRILREQEVIPVPVKISFPSPYPNNSRRISLSHPNGSSGNPDLPFQSKRFPRNFCFPVVFRSRAVKSREKIIFPNPAHTKTVHQNAFPREISPRVPRATDHQTGTPRAYSYICRREGWDWTGLGSWVYYVF